MSEVPLYVKSFACAVQYGGLDMGTDGPASGDDFRRYASTPKVISPGGPARGPYPDAIGQAKRENTYWSGAGGLFCVVEHEV